ncbi:MAG TPA: POT family MFS transporter [Luteolibacter sp.]|nr:POT family MFS transporter [Luteolibacter sp.]
MAYRTSPAELKGMPPGIPHIIGNEAAERFSFYGMKAVLAVFMVQYLHLMDGWSATGMSEAKATESVHLFTVAVYFTPILGALLADVVWGKYRTIIILSLVYCSGHAALALMGLHGQSPLWLAAGLGLIALGSGGIKPCVSAHVGDQFGSGNAHLLPRIFNWFYFSINVGAMLSALLTPWLLEWYGPHWAFGVPGVLMGLATLVFWMGRHRFIHVPAKGWRGFLAEFGDGGLKVMLKLLPLYLFVAIFWALFDQTSTRFVFQAQDMDRRFLGIEWLPSQLQSLNSIFVLLLIPLFAYFIYPLVDRVWKLTPLRKIGIGLVVMAASFALVSIVQVWIDGGGRPNIIWQIVVIALLTAAEVMVSIVALEFAYTQAPKAMKSVMMCYYLGSVALGNLLVAGVNHFIQIPSAAMEQWEEHVSVHGKVKDGVLALPGFDGKTGNEDDFSFQVVDGRPGAMSIPAADALNRAAAIIQGEALTRGGKWPAVAELAGRLDAIRDPWGSPLRYDILNSKQARLICDGPDRQPGTRWDLGLILELQDKPPAGGESSWWDALHPEKPWLERRIAALGAEAPAAAPSAEPITRCPFSGGQTRLMGADYFWFFTGLMALTALLFVPYALCYRPRTYLQD